MGVRQSGARDFSKAASDPQCQAAMRYYEETKCFISYERSFMRPVFE